MPIAISSGSAIRPASLPCCWRGSKIDHWRSPDGCATILQDPHCSHGRVLVLAEFLAIHQSDATLLGCVLRRLAGKVSLGSSERAAGVGFFQSDDLLLRKRPLGGQPALPEKLADGVESEATLICSGAVGTSARAFNEQITLPGLAAVVSNGRVMATLRRGHPLQVGVIDGLIPCLRDEIGPSANEHDPKVKSHRMLRAAMVLSGAQGTEGFREVAEREVIAIPRTLTDIRSL